MAKAMTEKVFKGKIAGNFAFLKSQQTRLFKDGDEFGILFKKMYSRYISEQKKHNKECI